MMHSVLGKETGAAESIPCHHSLPAQGKWNPLEDCGGCHCHTKQQGGKEVSWSSREHPALELELCVFNIMHM